MGHGNGKKKDEFANKEAITEGADREVESLSW